MTSTASSTATALVAPTRFLISFADMLVSDIDESKWADRCGTTINHPAFVLGHTAYYAGVCMQMLGGDIELTEKDGSLYKHGNECADEASWYPNKADSIAAFNDRINTVADFLESLDESAFNASSEDTFFAEVRSDRMREWLRQQQSPDARHWGMLTDFTAEQVRYAG